MKEGLAANNPVIATNRPHEPKSRERTLSDAELVEIWRAARDDAYGRIIRLLMLTGQRRDEVGGMAWSELALDKGLWSIPASRTKNKRAHDVPLSDTALAILREMPALGERDLVFTGGRGGFSGWSKAKEALDGRIAATRREAAVGKGSPDAAKPMPHWTLHDLRRTLATRAGDLGIAPHVVEALLNHVSGSKAGVAGVYNRSLYQVEKRTALEIWGQHIEHLMTDASPKVVSFWRSR